MRWRWAARCSSRRFSCCRDRGAWRRQHYAQKCDGVGSLAIELGNDAMKAGFAEQADAYFGFAAAGAVSCDAVSGDGRGARRLLASDTARNDGEKCFAVVKHVEALLLADNGCVRSGRAGRRQRAPPLQTTRAAAAIIRCCVARSARAAALFDGVSEVHGDALTAKLRRELQDISWNFAIRLFDVRNDAAQTTPRRG